jgi:hypothetical protein
MRLRAHSHIGEEQWHETGVDRHDALAAPLSLAHADQPSLEVDVVPVQAQKLRAAQAAVGKQRQQQAVALELPRVHASPDLLSAWRVQTPRELTAIEDVGQRFALLRRPQNLRRVALQVLALHAEAKKATQRSDRARLAGGRRTVGGLLGQETPQVGRADLGEHRGIAALQELKTGAHVALIRLACQLGHTALHAAVDEEVRHGAGHRDLRFRAGPSSLSGHL